jgi:uncharacterized phiE125 gp8 family phage protein
VFDQFFGRAPRRLTYAIRTLTAIDAITTAIDTEAAKAHLRVDFDDEDEEILDQVKAAQNRIEQHTSALLTPRSLEMTIDAFPCRAPICIPRSPVTSIDSIKYTDSSGDEQTLDPSAYRWSASDAQRILPAFSSEWPSAVACEPGAIRITFTAGYAEGECPPLLVRALKRLTAFYYENREGDGDLPPGVVSDCAPYRRQRI